MTTPTLCLVGSAARAEWHALAKWLSNELPEPSVTCVTDIGALESHIKGNTHPDLLLVLESWPDEFPASHVTRLLAAAPLSRIVCVAGAWCEAAGRTRSHWPPGLRVPFWLAQDRVRYELGVLAGQRRALPWTATRDEHIAQSSPLAPREESRGLQRATGPEAAQAALARTDRATFEIFDPALRAELSRQLEAIETSIADLESSLVLIEAEPSFPEVLSQVAARCRSASSVRVIAVTTWPLPEWCEQLRSAGVWAVVNPLDSDALRRAIADRLRDRASS